MSILPRREIATINWSEDRMPGGADPRRAP
jgi:hypothetical protein